MNCIFCGKPNDDNSFDIQDIDHQIDGQSHFFCIDEKVDEMGLNEFQKKYKVQSDYIFQLTKHKEITPEELDNSDDEPMFFDENIKQSE